MCRYRRYPLLGYAAHHSGDDCQALTGGAISRLSGKNIRLEVYLILHREGRSMIGALTRLLTRLIVSLPGSWLIRMSGRPQMTASGGRVFDPAGQFIAVTAIKQGIFGLDETKTVPELREIWKKQMKPFEKPRSGAFDDRTGPLRSRAGPSRSLNLLTRPTSLAGLRSCISMLAFTALLAFGPAEARASISMGTQRKGVRRGLPPCARAPIPHPTQRC